MTKAKLVFLSAQQRGKMVELTKDSYSCGRVPERDICIQDASVSSYHCDFIREGDSYMIRDHHSTNGIRVNNEVVTEAMLAHTDLLTIGTVEALFEIESGAVTVVRAETNIDIRPGDMTKTVVCIPPGGGFGTQLTRKTGPSKKTHTLIFLILGALALLVLVLGVLVAKSLFA